MKRYILLLGLLVASMSMAAGELTFNGTSHDVITIEPAANTGLNAIYVLYDTQGVSMTYNATTASYVQSSSAPVRHTSPRASPATAAPPRSTRSPPTTATSSRKELTAPMCG